MQSSSELHAPAATFPRMRIKPTEHVDEWAPQPFRTFREEKNVFVLFCLLVVHLIQVGK